MLWFLVFNFDFLCVYENVRILTSIIRKIFRYSVCPRTKTAVPFEKCHCNGGVSSTSVLNVMLFPTLHHLYSSFPRYLHLHIYVVSAELFEPWASLHLFRMAIEKTM